MAVAKVIEISSSSPDSFEDAIREGVTKASESLHGIESVWIKEQKADVANNQVTEFRVHMAVTFMVD